MLKYGAVAITDTVGIAKLLYRDFLGYIHIPENGLRSLALPYFGGLELSVYLHTDEHMQASVYGEVAAMGVLLRSAQSGHYCCPPRLFGQEKDRNVCPVSRTTKTTSISGHHCRLSFILWSSPYSTLHRNLLERNTETSV